ncbi:MAG: protein-glutamate O-methyltransferase CheR [Planctomycetaceae bacterium]|uniref:protein-glutamate O-methyltransferase n=1 Tax=Lacipirellula limnantheis TaxID=2528024 RepID=A0A517TXM7_9BACT|nr:protein-glutamate O-methyltransferase CheR [Lacipirellula limnantheis]MBL9162731.1 protein-glutamate O-methyltransferase CheR [Planctomycetaceae bacterium]QDT73128.1 Chemotaxis protein methyltransferase Cher2 [Lacipirellula limnantheis]
MADTTVSAADFAFVAKLVRERCALVLEPGKEYLVKARLLPLAERHGLAGIEPLIDRLRGSDSGLTTEVVEAMVVTETSFFRDIHPFETLKKTVLPKLIAARQSVRQLNIWFAASSSGQEPYSVALMLREWFPELNSWRLNLSATDVSHDMLDRSRAGRYSQVEVNRGLPTSLLLKWFRQEGAFWHLDERIRRTVTFSPLNLAQPWPAMPTWDLVFLRNVMIYFDNDVKKSILGRVGRVLSADGYLLLGGAETTFNLDDSFYRVETLRSGFYQLKPPRELIP